MQLDFSVSLPKDVLDHFGFTDDEYYFLTYYHLEVFYDLVGCNYYLYSPERRIFIMPTFPSLDLLCSCIRFTCSFMEGGLHDRLV